MKIFSTIFLLGSLILLMSAKAYADCTVKISGRAKLNQPMPGDAFQKCHRRIQQAIGVQANSFRFCREKYGNNGEALYLTLDVASDGKVAVGYEPEKIIEKSKTIEEAQASLKLSKCYEDRLKKISLKTSEGEYRCECPLPYQWDGSFPLKHSESKSEVFGASGAR